ncbi:hypothetical protein OHS58_00840 [Amycolatopsis sp. NBC_00348]|uniref:hypothetical protein n=1 Tax=Amycolatopsis sp. NBC_00348 TaxID=2975956 RepID=UPI002E256159
MSTTSLTALDDHRFPRGLAETLGRDGAALSNLEKAAWEIRVEPRPFVSWLAGLLTNDAKVAEIAGRSYWHPNGFAKLVLHTSAEPEFRIRLHVWPESDVVSPGESNPHSHRWEFASHILVGTGMHMVEFTEVADGGKPFRRYRYGADPAHPAALVTDGEVRLKRQRSPHVVRGEVYSCDMDVVHTVRPIDAGLTATVVIQGPRRTPATVVYCEPGESDDQPNGVLSEADFRRLMTAVLAAFKSEAAS